MSRQDRQRFFVDRDVQGKLMIRVAMYWVYCLIAVALMMSCFIVAFDRPANSGEFVSRLFYQTIPPLAASTLMLPILLFDAIRFSNLFAGPIFRLRRCMNHLADGKPVAELKFRNGDFWCEFAESFNRLNQRVQHLEARLAERDGEQTGSPQDEMLSV